MAQVGSNRCHQCGGSDASVTSETPDGRGWTQPQPPVRRSELILHVKAKEVQGLLRKFIQRRSSNSFEKPDWSSLNGSLKNIEALPQQFLQETSSNTANCGVGARDQDKRRKSSLTSRLQTTVAQGCMGCRRSPLRAEVAAKHVRRRLEMAETDLKTRGRGCTHRGVSLHTMGIPSLTPMEKKKARKTKGPLGKTDRKL